MKKSLSVFVLVLTVWLCFASCSSNMSNDEIAKIIGTNKLPTEICNVSYSIDVSNLKAVVGDSDYVVIAEVKNYVTTTYSASGMPLTEYTVRVVDNIKGKLDANKEISVVKEGGLNEKQTKFIMYENDILPQVGKYYIFCIYAQPDGSNRVCGQNYTLSIENGANYSSEQNYLNILDAHDNEIVSDRTRFHSQDEAK